jgi:hypothetical protein
VIHTAPVDYHSVEFGSDNHAEDNLPPLSSEAGQRRKRNWKSSRKFLEAERLEAKAEATLEAGSQ